MVLLARTAQDLGAPEGACRPHNRRGGWMIGRTVLKARVVHRIARGCKRLDVIDMGQRTNRDLGLIVRGKLLQERLVQRMTGSRQTPQEATSLSLAEVLDRANGSRICLGDLQRQRTPRIDDLVLHVSGQIRAY